MQIMRWNKLALVAIAALLSVGLIRWMIAQIIAGSANQIRKTGCECLWSLGDMAVWVEQDNETAVCTGGVRLYQRLAAGGYPMCRLSDPPAWMARRLRAGSVRTWLRLAVEAAHSAPSNAEPRRVSIWGHTGGDLITETVAHDHTWEEQLVAPLLERLLRLGVGNVTLIDIGCNIGVYTLQAATLGFPVIAVDANARNLLRIGMALYDPAPSVDVNAAAAPRPSSVSLLWGFISSDSSRLARLNYPGDCNIGGATKFARSVPDPVSVMPLGGDAISSLAPTKTVLVKLDAEGGEADFLRSGSRLFSERTVAAVQMEWLGRHLTGSDATDIVAFFVSRGYSAHQVDGKRRLDSSQTDRWPENVLWVHRDFGRLL